MANIEKASATLYALTNTASDLPIGAGKPFARVLKVAVQARAAIATDPGGVSILDTTVSLTITDAEARTVATIAQADYTNRTVFNLGPDLTRLFDTAGDPSAITEGKALGVIVKGPLTLTTGAFVTGAFDVEVYYEPMEVTSVVATADAATVGGGAFDRAVVVYRVDAKSSLDATVSCVVADSRAETIATLANTDYQTKLIHYVGPVETRSFDTGGDASADTEGTVMGVIAEGPFTITPTGLGSGTFTVDIYYTR